MNLMGRVRSYDLAVEHPPTWTDRRDISYRSNILQPPSVGRAKRAIRHQAHLWPGWLLPVQRRRRRQRFGALLDRLVHLSYTRPRNGLKRIFGELRVQIYLSH